MLFSMDQRPEDVDTASVQLIRLALESAKQLISLKTLYRKQVSIGSWPRPKYIKGRLAYEYLEHNQFVGLIHYN